MFEGLRNFAGLAGILKDMPRLKQRMERARERLAEVTVTAQSGGGAVRVTVTGMMRVVAVEADASFLAGIAHSSEVSEQAGHRALAQALIAEAVNQALDMARTEAEREFHAAAAELGLPLPPGALSGLMR
jgi:DNA-binding protein YbaB